LALAGLDGRIQGRAGFAAARAKTYRAIRHIDGPKILIVHRPDEVLWSPQSIQLVLAGHTHCGQIVLPLVGALVSGSDYGSKYLCGRIREGSKLLIVTSGLGTSHVPLRIGAPPDLWLITIGGT
jgi:predicted MPP superfamily phosphohydrolase